MPPSTGVAPVPPRTGNRGVIAHVVALAALGLAGCPGQGPINHPPPPVIQDMSLGPGDVIIIDVFNEPLLANKTFQVATDGTIDYPLIERITVAGMNPEAVATLITQMLVSGEFLKKPQVSVLVKEFHSKNIHVLGEVNKPGTFSFTDSMSIVEAITLAGGFTPLAKENKVSITRKAGDDKEIVFVVDMKLIISNKADNVQLQAGDIVYVPERIF